MSERGSQTDEAKSAAAAAAAAAGRSLPASARMRYGESRVQLPDRRHRELPNAVPRVFGLRRTLRFFLGGACLAFAGGGLYFVVTRATEWGVVAVVGMALLCFLQLAHILFMVTSENSGRAIVAAHDYRPRVEAQLSDRMRQFRALRSQSERASHPLLASEIDGLVIEGDEILSRIEALGMRGSGVGTSPEMILLHRAVESFLARYPVANLKRRILRAQLAYRLNLPLARENALNFAVMNMADRIDRLTDLIAPRFQAPTVNNGWDGSRV